ncbi:MAG: MgtC/SapB family protein, partial [Spirochaeta sp.]|nr:MgtC/SapB family protein [Spirochaeta sp.]
MEWFQALVVSQEITLGVSIFRLMITALLVGCVGLERQTNNQPAGLRTHILIGVGASLLMLLSIYVPQQYRDFPSGDPSRIAAQVVSGIGFLGGGAILKFGADIRGLTTAASIWTVAAIGLAVGAGLFGAATFSTVLVLFTLITLNQVERRFFPKQMMKTLTIYTMNSTISVEDIRRAISKAEIKIRS